MKSKTTKEDEDYRWAVVIRMLQNAEQEMKRQDQKAAEQRKRIYEMLQDAAEEIKRQNQKQGDIIIGLQDDINKCKDIHRCQKREEESKAITKEDLKEAFGQVNIGDKTSEIKDDHADEAKESYQQQGNQKSSTNLSIFPELIPDTYSQVKESSSVTILKIASVVDHGTERLNMFQTRKFELSEIRECQLSNSRAEKKVIRRASREEIQWTRMLLCLEMDEKEERKGGSCLEIDKMVKEGIQEIRKRVKKSREKLGKEFQGIRDEYEERCESTQKHVYTRKRKKKRQKTQARMKDDVAIIGDKMKEKDQSQSVDVLETLIDWHELWD